MKGGRYVAVATSRGRIILRSPPTSLERAAELRNAWRRQGFASKVVKLK